MRALHPVFAEGSKGASVRAFRAAAADKHLVSFPTLRFVPLAPRLRKSIDRLVRAIDTYLIYLQAHHTSRVREQRKAESDTRTH